MKLILTTILYLLAITICYGGNEKLFTSSRSSAMAHASVCNSDITSLSSNPAGISEHRQFAASSGYQNSFLIPDLSSKSLLLILPITRGCFGVSASIYGNKLYNEIRYSSSYSLQLGKLLSSGIQFHFIRSSIADKNYPAQTAITAEFGLQYKLPYNLRFGTSIYNPGFTSQEQVPSLIRIGIAKEFSKIFICTELEKHIRYPVSVKIGLEYQVVKDIFIRAGTSSNTKLFSFGFGIKKGRYTLDNSTSYHQELGYSPDITFSYSF